MHPLPNPCLHPPTPTHAGFPSVGKSSLLTELTGTNSEAAAYEFTTLTCIPGVIHYNDAKIQLLDLPGIIEGAAEGKGRGRQVGACVSRTFDGAARGVAGDASTQRGGAVNVSRRPAGCTWTNFQPSHMAPTCPCAHSPASCWAPACAAARFGCRLSLCASLPTCC